MADKLIFDYANEAPARSDNVLTQASIGALYKRATIAQILAALEAGDIPDISASYVPVTPQSNIYYVGKHGNNSNAGTSPGLAYLTFGAAMTAASSGDAIVCFDGGNYAEGLTCKAGVSVFAPNATLTVTGSQLVMEEATVIFDKVTRASGGDAMILFDGATGRQKLTCNIIDDNGAGIAVRMTNTSIPIVTFKELYVSGGGTGIADFTASEHYHITGRDLYLNSDNAVGIHQAVAGNNAVVAIEHIVEIGTRTGTVALDVDAGTINLFCHEIIADTAWDVESGATLNIVGCRATGTKLNDGTVNKLLADDRTQTHGLFIPIAAPADGDYLVALNLPKAITITKVTSKSTAGTCTATVKIGATALGGTANSVSSTEQEQAHSTNNVAATGDDITVTVSANSGCENMSLMIEYTTELD